jgi:phage/plasmid-associated DNA primase/5S rRNA maturation endonuclease (ribonuclease M5)
MNSVRLSREFLFSLDWVSIIHSETEVSLNHFNPKGGQSCPHCGGTDRFHFTNTHKNGTFICRNCGSSDGIGLICLLRHKLNSVGSITKQMRNEVYKELFVKYGNNSYALKQTPHAQECQSLRAIIPANKNLDYRSGTKINLYKQDGSQTLIHNYEKFWEWLGYDGSLIGYIGRKSNKHTHQIYLTEKGWTQGSIGSSRPLFGLQCLQNNLPVIIVEGETTWEAVHKNVSNYAVITWVGGANAVNKSDWSILQDREIYIFPDNDTPGFNAARQIESILRKNNSVRIIYPPSCKPDKWDLADEKEINDHLIETLISKQLPTQESDENVPSVVNLKDLIYSNGRTVGELVLDELYRNGDLIYVSRTLRRYEDGYYKQLDDEYEKHKILQLLRRVITNMAGNKNFATSKHVDEALKFIKLNFTVHSDKINPPGLNLKNGYLKLSYDRNREPVFQLIPHSSKFLFTYKSDVKFDPNISSDYLTKVLNEMLSPEQSTALLRTLAAIFDINKVREVRPREDLRILILKGDGINGKDTLRSWFEKIFSGQSFSSIPLQIFAQADSERVFRLSALLDSRINWASENKSVPIDEIQILKQIITGENITIEKKGCDPIDIPARILCVFHLNDMPIIKTNQESIKSRFAIIEFLNIFKANPDPSKPYEKKVDPRLKHDIKLLNEELLPALLNRLIHEFKLLLKDGIDFRFQDNLVSEIKKESNHLHAFVSECNLVECAASLGFSSKELYDKYIEWCHSNGYSDEGGSLFSDDKIVKSSSAFTKRLKSVFPRLKIDKFGNIRKVGLKVAD